MNKKQHINFEENPIDDGFQPNSEYLAQVESSLFEALGIEEKLNVDKDGYNASEEYFDTLEENVLTAVEINTDTTEHKPSRVIKLNIPKVKWIAAASVAAVIGLLYFKPFSVENNEVDFASLSKETAQYYLTEQELFFTDDELSFILENEVYDIQIEDENLQKELEEYLIINEVFPLEIYK